MNGRRYTRSALMGAMAFVALAVGCHRDSPVFDTRVDIDTAPQSGATVSINGQPYGTSPISVKGLPPGLILVEVTLDGFRRAYDTYRVPDSGSIAVTLTMERLEGEVSFESEPTNAAVYVDGGKFLGTTPLAGVKLPEGAHKVEVRKDRYEPLTETIAVRADYKYTKLFTLTPRESRIEIYSTPSSAAIYLNNAIQNEKTPARIVVQPGTYTVGVYKGGYIMAEEVVTVEPASDAVVNLTMKEGEVPPGMVLIPGGEFIMGTDDKSPDEKPKRNVYVEAFYMDKYEVTNAQYKLAFPEHTFPKGQEEYPVTGLTWEQATEYAKAVGKRLPTETEWEKAARGTDGREYPWGNLWEPANANVNTGSLNPKVLPVGHYRAGASPYGCLDMAGNVYEWTSSWYSRYEGNTAIIKEYGQVFRVLRGGSYRTGPFEARCMTRRYDLMTNKRDDYGLRCAKDVAQGPPGKGR